MHNSTIEWYVGWLKEVRPDWTDEQRLEIATGFATQQQPPVRPTEIEEDEELAAKDAQAAHFFLRSDERRLHKLISGLLKEASE